MRSSLRRLSELGFWRAMQDAPSLALVDGALDPRRDIAGVAGHVRLTLPGCPDARRC